MKMFNFKYKRDRYFEPFGMVYLILLIIFTLALVLYFKGVI